MNDNTIKVTADERITGADHEAFGIVPGSRQAGVVFLCDHATNLIPQEYAGLGMPAHEMKRHIAYDAGTLTIGRRMAAIFDAPCVYSKFSRLLIDPNRGSDDPTLVMRISDGALVPGNAYIDDAEITMRQRRFHQPYHDAIAAVLDSMLASGIIPAIVSIHSFTPEMKGIRRPWHVGMLWDNDPRLSCALIERLAREDDLVVGDNEPYDGGLPGDTINRHATHRGLASTLIEVRNDLVQADEDAERWALRLADALRPLLDDPDVHRIMPLTSRVSPRARSA